MNDRSQDYLEDILESITKIEEYLHDLDFLAFQRSSLLQDAVIRNIEIVGEAMGRLSEEFLRAHPNLPIQDAVSMRNFLIHQYDGVDVELLWETARDDLPLLKDQVVAILKQPAGK